MCARQIEWTFMWPRLLPNEHSCVWECGERQRVMTVCICGGMPCWRILLLMLSPGELLLPGVQWTKRGVCMCITSFLACLSTVTKTDRRICLHLVRGAEKSVPQHRGLCKCGLNKQWSKRLEIWYEPRKYLKTKKERAKIKSELQIGQDGQLVVH